MSETATKTETKSRPILFSGPMVRAILEGRKTQTRRVVKPVGNDGGVVLSEQADGSWWPYRSFDGTYLDDGNGCEVPLSSPYGVPGDELWVRETWVVNNRGDTLYRADFQDTAMADDAKCWKPSIHMPRSACRLTLTVTGVRVERLNDITEADATAEGSYLGKCSCLPPGNKTPMEAAFRQTMCRTHGTEFRHLWESINGRDSWTENPWVWVVEFERKAVAS